MKRWKLWAGVLLVFAAGACVGVVGTGLYVRHSFESLLQGGPPAVAELVTNRLARELDLSKSQKIAVGETVQEMQSQIQALRLQYRPEAKQILITGMSKMKTELSAEQQQKLDRLYNKLTTRWRLNE